LVQKLKEAQNGGLKETEKAILKAHKITNDSMHADTSIDTSLSGTTSVTVLFHEKTMFVSNVGDSRAIVVSTDIEGIKVHAMSSDQTPYRKDERFRVMKYGARVLSVQQVLQNDISVQDNWGNITLGDEIDEAGDPPRVWSQEGDFPGTAFTRSFGDQIAEELGVTAEPEILVRDVDSHDKYVVIASDGVFEFLTNQMVADIVAEKEDPLEACHAVVAAAYDLWLRFDVRTDDITIVILQFMDMVPGPLSEEKASPKNLSFQNQFFSSARIFNSRQPPPVTPSASVLNESRPVRRVISREKRKKITFTPIYEREGCNQNISTTETHSVAVLKSEKDAQAIGGAIKLNFLFQHLNVAERNELISFMQPMTVKAGDWVIKQGDEGNNFYVIDHGRFEVRVKPDGSDDINGGSVVHVYESGKDQHPGFGELALL
jgi:serine/threonine protein phosphatase PrpC